MKDFSKIEKLDDEDDQTSYKMNIPQFDKIEFLNNDQENNDMSNNNKIDDTIISSISEL